MKNKKATNKKVIYSILTIIVIIGAVWGAMFFLNHKKHETFYKEYNVMNDDYKKVLFATGQNKTESTALYEKYQQSWNTFYTDFKSSPIEPYSSDDTWTKSLDEINSKVVNAGNYIENKQLHDAHLQFEAVRGVWQKIFAKNDVSMLGFYLTEFHDVMEKAVDGSAEPDYAELENVCADLHETWNMVETIDSDNPDLTSKEAEEKQNIENFCNAVDKQDGTKLVDLSSKLKKDFIALYLKYG